MKNYILKHGNEVKNYKEMCKILNEPEKGGKSKQLQLKNWARLFSFEKEKHSFKILEIYETEIKKNKRKSVYIELIEILLACESLKEKKSIIILSKKKCLKF